jgi:hypothetical protein
LDRPFSRFIHMLCYWLRYLLSPLRWMCLWTALRLVHSSCESPACMSNPASTILFCSTEVDSLLVLLQNLNGKPWRRNVASACTARCVGAEPSISVPEMSISNARILGRAIVGVAMSYRYRSLFGPSWRRQPITCTHLSPPVPVDSYPYYFSSLVCNKRGSN